MKRLKREMQVALGEEDYNTAIRLRDHPFMRLHLRIMQLVQNGRAAEAEQLQVQLAANSAASETMCIA